MLARSGILFALLALSPLLACADSLLEEGLREFEELRLRQLHTVQADGGIATFTTDGCSGNLSTNWKLLANGLPGFADEFGDEPPWEDCCVAHDKSYWRGETADGYALRLETDRQLRQCVVATGEQLVPELSRQHGLTEQQVRQAFEVIADLMFRAVRLGGQPCSLLPWRWGYGWPGCAFAAAAEIPPSYSDIETDENVVFFDGNAWLHPAGEYWTIPIHAWIYEPGDSQLRLGAFAAALESAYGLKVSADTQSRFRRRGHLLLADNERGKRLVIRIAGQDHELPLSAKNGHVHAELKLPLELVNAVADEGRIRFFAVLRVGDQRRFEGEVRLLRDTGIGVISDIDDTLKISNVTDRKRLFDNTFYQPFRVVGGMPELYRRLAADGASLHYVSSSPWQLYSPLREFFGEAGFPRAGMSLKHVRFRDETLLDLFKKGTETKPAQIEPILERYPGRRFILVGDSGEQDPEVYAGIARSFPARIIKILIRNVDGSDAAAARYQAAFRGIAGEKWQLFTRPNEISASALLANSE